MFAWRSYEFDIDPKLAPHNAISLSALIFWLASL